MAVYYFPNLLLNPALQENAQAQFIPTLLLTREYWAGWFSNVREVIGPVAFVGALLGVLSTGKGAARALLLSMWTGYVIFILVFTYLVNTHDYYQLQLIPIVALSLGPLVSIFAERLASLSMHPATRATLLVTLVVLATLFSQLENWWRRYYHEYESVAPDLVEIAQEIGEVVNHSPYVILLSQASAAPLRYYGEVSGPAWPAVSEVRLASLYGAASLTSRQRLDRMILTYSPQYFVITDFAELERQPELRELLVQTYHVLSSTDSYIVFDLRSAPLR